MKFVKRIRWQLHLEELELETTRVGISKLNLNDGNENERKETHTDEAAGTRNTSKQITPKCGPNCGRFCLCPKMWAAYM